MDTIYVVVSADSSGVELVSAFVDELDAQAEVIRLINEETKFYSYREVELKINE